MNIIHFLSFHTFQKGKTCARNVCKTDACIFHAEVLGLSRFILERNSTNNAPNNILLIIIYTKYGKKKSSV